MRARHRSWSDLSGRQRRAVVVIGAAEVGLAAAAFADLARRPAEEVRGGRKWPWALACLVNFAGPISYLTIGRRRS